jgi:hypothetical protein
MLNSNQKNSTPNAHKPKHYKSRSSKIEIELPGSVSKQIGALSVRIQRDSGISLSKAEISSNILKEVLASPEKAKIILDNIEQTCVRISQRKQELDREMGELRGIKKAQKSVPAKSAPVISLNL